MTKDRRPNKPHLELIKTPPEVERPLDVDLREALQDPRFAQLIHRLVQLYRQDPDRIGQWSYVADFAEASLRKHRDLPTTNHYISRCAEFLDDLEKLGHLELDQEGISLFNSKIPIETVSKERRATINALTLSEELFSFIKSGQLGEISGYCEPLELSTEDASKKPEADQQPVYWLQSPDGSELIGMTLSYLKKDKSFSQRIPKFFEGRIDRSSEEGKSTSVSRLNRLTSTLRDHLRGFLKTDN